MTKLMEKLEKVTEERKQKERTLLKLYEEEGKTMDSSDDEDNINFEFQSSDKNWMFLVFKSFKKYYFIIFEMIREDFSMYYKFHLHIILHFVSTSLFLCLHNWICSKNPSSEITCVPFKLQ